MAGWSVARCQIPDELDHIVREVVSAEVPGAAQRSRRLVVGPWCSPQSQVNATGVECLEGAELLRHDKR